MWANPLRWLRRRSTGARARDAKPRLLHRPIDLVPGDVGRGEGLIAGLYDFDGQAVRAGERGDGGDTPWQHRGAGAYWLDELHGFAWLRDLHAAGTGRAAERGRSLVLDWLRQHRTIEHAAAAWGPDSLGRRLSAWLAHSAFLLEGADDDFTRRFHQGLDLQARHLARTARSADDGLAQLVACKGLIESGLCLPEGERRAAQGLELLEAALARQLLGDGGHVERNPSAHLAATWCLAGLRATLDAADRPAVPALSTGLSRLVPALRMFRHGDGRLALFNGGVEEEQALIDLALDRAAPDSTTLLDAPDTGFRRIEGKHATLIADTGTPAAAGRWAHAGALSIEMSAGRERLIVNCGSWRGGGSDWREALRGTAAHSTLVVDDTNTATLEASGAIADGPSRVRVERRDQDGATWLDASHDGYLDSLGLTHKRRLYAGAAGADVRGEDTLVHIRQRQRQGREFALRFHLHPDVRCAMTEDRRAVLLRLPSGAVWQMRAGGASMSIDESVYAGDGMTRRRTSQVALTGPIGETTTVKWALRLLPKGS